MFQDICAMIKGIGATDYGTPFLSTMKTDVRVIPIFAGTTEVMKVIVGKMMWL